MKTPALICKACRLIGRQKHSFSCQLLLALHMKAHHGFSLRNSFGFVTATPIEEEAPQETKEILQAVTD
jgi:hypothetical protein